MSETTTRTVTLNFCLDVTPVKRVPTVESRWRAAGPAIYGHDILIKEALRIERLAARNELQGKKNGADHKRGRAARLRRAAEILADVARQIQKAR